MEKPKWNYELYTISKDNCPWCQLYSASFQGSTYKREESRNNFGQDFAFIQSTISQTSSRIHNDVLFYFCPGWQSITTDFFTKHVQDFCPLKIKITQCPGGFCLNCIRKNSFSYQWLCILSHAFKTQILSDNSATWIQFTADQGFSKILLSDEDSWVKKPGWIIKRFHMTSRRVTV